MSTDIRPELSKKNKYWIERHRYYELKHFCLQYYFWKRAYSVLDGFCNYTGLTECTSKTNTIHNPTEKNAERRLFYSNRISMVEQIAIKTDETLSKYILMAVTQGISYETLKTKYNIPCCKDVYYDLYRRFFWLLDKERE